jgi:hypothetical protein
MSNESLGLSTLSQATSLGLVGTGTLSVPLPFESKIVLLESVRIAGTTHVPHIEELMESIPEDAILTFVREPHNKADRWAIRIDFKGKKVGYLPADNNEILARLMDGGKTLQGTLVSREKQGNWWKVYMEVDFID